MLDYLHIYGNNTLSGSINSDSETQYEEPELYCSDFKIVEGNYDPLTTLYIILTEDDLPECFTYYICSRFQPDEHLDSISKIVRDFTLIDSGDKKDQVYVYYRQITKEELLKLREKFLKDNFPDTTGILDFTNALACKYLDTDEYYQDTLFKYVLDLDSNVEVDDE